MPEPFTQSNVTYGGQAVLEGVMMRGTRAMSVAVRNPQGEIVVHTEGLDARIYGGRLARIPFLRGLTLLWDALGLGVKSLMFSAEVAMQEEGQQEGGEEPAKVFEGPAAWGTVALSLAFSIGLFFLLPVFIAGQLQRWWELSSLATHLVEGLARLLLLVGYVAAIGLLPDIRRLYGYHGAEHKTINAYEAGAELTPQSVARFPLEHPRCGTAFLLTVVVISILVFSLLPPLELPLRLASRVVLLPLVAGIAYEFIRFSARHQDKALIRWITRPNLALQRLTTREPDAHMLEVAISAFNHVLALEVEPEPALAAALVVEPSAG